MHNLILHLQREGILSRKEKNVFLKSCSLHTDISATGKLLFMMCESLTLAGLISAWRRGEPSVGNFGGADAAFVWDNANQRIWKFVFQVFKISLKFVPKGSTDKQSVND